ncbi:TORC2 complex subunit TSC11 [Sporobolomyces salmoneus]|uniref:TORC2 complex subunit TSC11 n=1 Tax=Sporobolomyces salmoneus TaxID=183962 RepID=UPI00316DBDCB
MSTPPSRISFDYNQPGDATLSLQVQLENLREQLSVQQAIADGAQNFLAVIVFQDEAEQSGQQELKHEIEQELRGAEDLISFLQRDIDKLKQQIASAPISTHTNGYAASDYSSSYHGNGVTDQTSRSYPALDKVNQLFDDLSRLDEEINERIRIMDELVDSFQNDAKLGSHFEIAQHLDTIIDCLEEKAGKDVRSATYRLLRHVSNSTKAVRTLLLDRHLHFYLIRSLGRDSKHDLEKEQALRLIRRILELSTTLAAPPDSTSPSDSLQDHERLHSHLVAVLRGVVAIAEQPEEKLRLASLETLGELVIRDVSLLVKCEGLRVVLQAMSDGGPSPSSTSGGGGGGLYNEMSIILSTSFLGIIDHPDLRRWLRPGIDLEIVLSGFTEVQGKGSGIEERIKASSMIVETLLKSWSGLMYLNVNGRQALTSLVDSLTNPSRVVRDTLLDMLSNIFNVERRRPVPPHIRANDQPLLNDTSSKVRNGTKSEQTKTNLIDQFTAILLLTFIDAGLVEGLAELAANPQDSSTSLRVSTLIGELLDLSNRVLPARHAAVLQSLPRLFALSTEPTTNPNGGTSTSNGSGDQKLKASDTLLMIAGLNREKRIIAASRRGREEEEENLANSEDVTAATALQRNEQQRQLVESDKLRVALSIDDVSFRNSLLETGVLSTKEDAKWSFDLLIDLLEGPLRNPKRLDEAMRASKFMKRLLGFFHPLSFKYSDTRKDETTIKYTRLGCTMINTLLSDPQGAQYLAEDKLLPQIADCLLQLEPVGGSTSGLDLLFSKERVETTLVSGYFDMLGEMTRSPTGLAILDQYKIFTCFYRIGELRSREDLVRLVLEKCDYARDGHPRVFLHKALTSSYKHIRLFATNHLGTLIRQSSHDFGPSKSRSRTNEALEWQIDLLVPQLYDPAPEVTQLAVSILTRACTNEDTLELVVRKQPQVEHLGDAAVELLTQFLGTPVGVRYLHEIDFIEQELKDWYEERNYRYMVEIELSLAAALQTEGGVFPPTTFDGTPPSHFYGELVRTSEGCEILDDSEHFLRFCDIIRDHADERDFEPSYIAQLKSVLWAVGHIGSTENGLMFIEDEFILPDIVEIACTSPVYSLRGTAVFALSLISSTLEGVEMLEELGWESVVKPLTGPSGLCIPMELNDLVYTPNWPPPELPLPESLSFAPPTSHVDRDAMISLANLSNHILATKASKQLAKLKSRHRSHFASPTLYYRALDMLASHHYRQPVRKYILELFDYDFDLKKIQNLVSAGQELVTRRRRELDQSADDQVGHGGKTPSWARTTVSAMMGSGRIGIGGIEGEVTEDEDQSSIDNDDLETMMNKVPLQILTPLLTVKGFLLSS